ncbi:MAG: diguanylate cyclase [Firmicutes bacterium]|nr:diguanylate cyclase [Bacillota bacterium]
MQEWQRERKEKLADLTLGAHIIAYLIAVAVFICSKPLHINHLNNLYNATIKISSILFPAATFILLDVFFLLHKGRSLADIWNVAKHLALFLLITLVFLYNGKDLTSGSLYLLPVVLSSLTLGRGWGLAFAAAASGCLVALTGIFTTTAFTQRIEMPFVFSALFFLAAWFLGGIIEIEKQTTVKLARIANEDGLTGLANHRFFYERLKKEVEIALANNRPLSLVFLDIDFFKNYNDTFGHQQGDLVLRELGKLLQGVLPADTFLARYGGEEFAVILPALQLEEAAEVARKLHQAVANHAFPGENCQPFSKLTISAGVATLPDHAKNVQELVDAADEALYSSKWTGRNKVRCYLAVLERLSRSAKKNDLVLIESLRTLMTVINARDRYTYGHSERVAYYAGKIGEKLGLSLDELRLLEYGAFLHDVGKLEIQREVLTKTGELSKTEWDFVRQHPLWGAEILKPIKALQPVIPAIMHHHENYDGSGYPDGLKGEEIPFFARILRVIDSFDAMTTNRPYRRALSKVKALDEIALCSGRQYDPQVVEAFRETLTETGKTISLLDYI